MVGLFAGIGGIELGLHRAGHHTTLSAPGASERTASVPSTA